MNLKNSGKVAWPRGFKIKNLLGTDDSIQSHLNDVVLLENEQIMLDIFIKNPKAVGKYYYMFSLVDFNGRKFGKEFSFKFEVKNNSFIYNNQYAAPVNPYSVPVRYNNK